MIKKKHGQASNKQIGQFGLVMLVAFTLLGIVFIRKHRLPLACVFFSSGVLLALAAKFTPKQTIPIYKAWMTLGELLGAVTSRIMMTIIFILVITPVGCVFRLFGRDTLQLRRGKTGESYWKNLPKVTEPESYKHLF